MSLRLLSRSVLITGVSLLTSLLAGCGDDTTNEETTIDAGSGALDASDPEGEITEPGTVTESETPTETETHSEQPDAATTAVETSCQQINDVCGDFEDPIEEGFAELCARVAVGEDQEQCLAIEGDCLAYCDPDAEPEPSTIDGEVACDEMGDRCHEPDHGSGLENLCHETGHQENPEWCAAIYDECKPVCDGLGEGNAGASHGHDELDGGQEDAASDADVEQPDVSDAGDASALQPITLQFKAAFGDREFACGEEYSAQGTPPTVVTPQDLRFYVSEVRLINAQGDEVPVNIDERSPYQGGDVALLDFEDGSGACINGDTGLNATITGTVPAGDYVGIAFKNSVPFELNHEDPTTLPAPLQAGAMSWGWLYGYKFFVAEVAQVAGSPMADAGPDAGAPVPGVGLLHLGSTDCVNDFGPDAGVDWGSPPTTACGKSNRNEIQLLDFAQGDSIIVVDLAQLFASTDLTAMSMCHSAGDACPALFENAGVSFETGGALTEQSLFRLE